MSLGGLAISIGMIIDATIIQVENVQRYLAQPDDTRPKIQRGAARGDGGAASPASSAS